MNLILHDNKNAGILHGLILVLLICPSVCDEGSPNKEHSVWSQTNAVPSSGVTIEGPFRAAQLCMQSPRLTKAHTGALKTVYTSMLWFHWIKFTRGEKSDDHKRPNIWVSGSKICTSMMSKTTVFQTVKHFWHIQYIQYTCVFSTVCDSRHYVFGHTCFYINMYFNMYCKTNISVLIWQEVQFNLKHFDLM